MNRSGSKKDVELVEYRVGKEGYLDAARYDAIRYHGPANEYKQRVMQNAYTQLVGHLEGKRILDVGCGTGRGLIPFARKATFAIGSDASHDMLAFAARKAVEDLPCALVQAHAQGLPFADASFDVVTALNFLHIFSVETQREMIAEMKRVARPGGFLVLEFDNALQGLLLGLYKRYFRDERGSLPGEIRYVLGDHCRVVQIYGAVFPVVWRLFRHFPKIFVSIEKITYLPPFNRLSHRIYYKVQRISSLCLTPVRPSSVAT
jgi:ubiquinone/menaquinone biosynthesis C-methylase UbiE